MARGGVRDVPGKRRRVARIGYLGSRATKQSQEDEVDANTSSWVTEAVAHARALLGDRTPPQGVPEAAALLTSILLCLPELWEELAQDTLLAFGNVIAGGDASGCARSRAGGPAFVAGKQDLSARTRRLLLSSVASVVCKVNDGFHGSGSSSSAKSVSLLCLLGEAQADEGLFMAAFRTLQRAQAMARQSNHSSDRAEAALQGLRAAALQRWHFQMINDVPRAEAYDRAIQAAVSTLSQRPEKSSSIRFRVPSPAPRAGEAAWAMPQFSLEQVRSIMDQTEKIRSLSIIAHVDHGKTTLADSLVSRAGIISTKAAGDTKFTHGRKDEQERGVTIKSTGVTLCLEHDQGDGHGQQPYLVNLIDSPGHVDFSSEVTAALRITDGAIVVVDCIEGCAVQTETVLRQALQERVKPCLFVNKVDRCILEMQMEAEDMYLRFRNAIENVNVIIATYNDSSMGDLQVRPELGNVAFGSGLHGWGFSIETFAKILSAKSGMEKSKMMEKLWGDWFYNPKKKVWTNVQQPEDCEEPLQRGFCQYVMNPINQLIRAIMDKDSEKYEKMMARVGIVLKGEDKNLTGKALMKHVMQNWINAGESLVAMVVMKLPPPKLAQRYRVENLYDGPMDDEAAMGIRNCDPSGPLMMYVSKMVPAADKSRFYAFGRVFSGTVATGQKVRIQGPHYRPGSRDDLHVRAIQRTVLMMGRGTELIQDVPCGNTVALVGVDQYILKSGTITTLEDAHNFTDMKYSVSPVVKVAVKPKDGKDLPKLVEGLKRLSKSDQLVVCSTEESGEHVIAGCGELHVEICLKDLREEFAQCDFTVSDPVVSYRETVTEESNQTCLAKSANKHNRLYLKAEPLDGELVQAIEQGQVGPKADCKEAAKLLTSKFGWDKQVAQSKIWCFGPECDGANMVVDTTIGAQYLADIKDSVTSAFQWATKEGPLCEENMRGIRFNLTEVMLHPDKVHQGGGQIMPATRRACFASELTAKPTLQEPVFLVEISCPKDSLSGIYNCLNLRRGCVFEENQREGTPLVQVKAHLPVSESFGFVGSLRQATSGQAFPQCVFDHWESLPGNCLEKGSKMEELVLSIRKRKNLKLQMPLLADYLDKL